MVAEIISRVERRRGWPPDEKLRILGEALEPGASITAVADRNGVCRSLIYSWLRLARDDRLPGVSMNARQVAPFVPVRVEAPAVAPPTDWPSQPPRRRASLVEITLPNGRVVKIDEGIDPATLAAIIAVLDGKPT